MIITTLILEGEWSCLILFLFCFFLFFFDLIWGVRWYPISQGRRTVEKDLSKKWTSASVATFGRGSHKCLGFRVAEAEVMSFFTTVFFLSLFLFSFLSQF